MSTFRASSIVEIGEYAPETFLWRAVIERTIQDWISASRSSQREAEQYLFSDNKDFALVCQSAGMDAGQLRSRLRRLRGNAISDHVRAVA